MSSKYPPFPCIDINDYTQHGDYVKTIHLTSPQGMKASILTLGARLIDLRLPDNRPLSLSLTTLQQIEADQAYIGVAVGRTANRIKHGILPSSRAAHSHVELQKNEEDRNHTHGGKRAWDKRLFAVRHVSKSSVDLYMFSPDGDQGYPSSVEVCVRYELRDEGQLAISLITTNVGRHQTVTNMTVRSHSFLPFVIAP